MDGPQAIAIIALAALAITLVLTGLLRKLDRARDSSLRRRRSLRALDAESASETLLVSSGYTILGRQVPGSITVLVDGEESLFDLRADLIVGDGERDFVAEVKTGQRAPSLAHAATRRQLLEYSVAFDVDGVLLVDAEAGEVFEVDFGLALEDEKTSQM